MLHGMFDLGNYLIALNLTLGLLGLLCYVINSTRKFVDIAPIKELPGNC